MNKTYAYEKLVKKRKEFSFRDQELTNPSTSSYDLDQIEPWAQWHNNLNAKILLVGQEFCDLETYTKDQGKIELTPQKFRYSSNKNLTTLFSSIGIELGHPLTPNKNAPLFFTNAVMGLKNGSMSSNFKDKWMTESREQFLLPLIEIIQPKIIITLGSKAFTSLATTYKIPIHRLREQIILNPVSLTTSMNLFAMYHPGKLGTISRPLNVQMDDWQAVKPYL